MCSKNDNPTVPAIGRHLLADLFDVDAMLLTDEHRLLQLLVEALQSAGFNIIRSVSHAFPGEQAGVTGMALLSESHAAFHTYPEHRYMALDIFSCGQPSPERALDIVIETLQPGRVESTWCPRGVISAPRVRTASPTGGR